MGVDTLLGVQAAGTAFSTVGAYYAGREQQEARRAEADMEEINAQLSDLSAEEAIRSGAIRRQKVERGVTARKGKQKATLAARGIDLASESAAAVLLSTEVIGEQEADEITRQALAESFGYRIRSVSARNRAALRRAEAGAISPLLGAVPTLLTGASKVATTAFTLGKFDNVDFFGTPR